MEEMNNVMMEDEINEVTDVESTELDAIVDDSESKSSAGEIALVAGVCALAAYGAYEGGKKVVKGVKWAGGKVKEAWNAGKEKRAAKKAAKAADKAEDVEFVDDVEAEVVEDKAVEEN